MNSQVNVHATDSGSRFRQEKRTSNRSAGCSTDATALLSQVHSHVMLASEIALAGYSRLSE